MKKILVIIVLVSFGLSKIAWSQTTGLVGYYTLDNDINDYSGNNLHGIQNNGATFVSDRFGHANMAIQVNGSSDIDITHTEFKLDSFTYCLWVYFDKLPPNNDAGCFISFGVTNANQSFVIWNNSTVNIWNPISYKYTPSRTSSVVSSTPTIQTGKWYHTAYVRTTDSILLYVNGKFVSSSYTGSEVPAYSYNNQTYKCTLGSRMSITEWFTGRLDDVHIYNKPFTASEVMECYNPVNDNVGIDPTEPFKENYIYPNPASDRLFISLENSGRIFKVTVIGIDGRELYTPQISKDNSIDVSALAKGIYILKLTNEKNETKVTRFVKQ